jgi:hypothetical protein
VHGDAVAGRKLEIMVCDDGGVANNARRLVQEMIVNDKVGLIGIGTTLCSLAVAPLVTEAKIPPLVLSSGASVTVTKSPYMVPAGFLQGQQAWIMAEWAFNNGSKRVVTLVNDWARASSPIKIVGPADLTDDDDTNTMGDQMLGINTSGSYSAAHGSALNKACVAAFEEASGFRPDFDWVGAYDGLHLIHEAFKKDERKRRWRHLD